MQHDCDQYDGYYTHKNDPVQIRLGTKLYITWTFRLKDNEIHCHLINIYLKTDDKMDD